MRRLLVLVMVVGCGGGTRAPEPAKPVPADVVATPAPTPTPAPTTPNEPIKPAEQVAIGGTGDDPCDGGEVRGDNPCDGGEANGGLGVRGSGVGGGGTGSGPGVGSVGTIGTGSGTGRGGGAGAPGLRHTMVPKVTLGKHQVKGKLDAEIIRRVVRQHLNQIRYCYEKLLMQNAEAAGKLTLTFVIAPEGTVAQAKGTGVAPDLETCVAGRVITWIFPKPKSGIVQVSYPIVFAPSS